MYRLSTLKDSHERAGMTELHDVLCCLQGIEDAEAYNEPEKAVLVAVGSAQHTGGNQQSYSLVQSLEELAGLAETAGVKVCLSPLSTYGIRCFSR